MRLEVVDSKNLVYLIHDFLLPVECQGYIALGESRGFTPAPITTARGPVMAPDVRSNTRVMFDDPGLALGLWRRLQALAPPRAVDGRDQECRAIGLNERIRLFRYEKQQRFAPHYDGSFQRHIHEGSLLTFMVYLNDDFQGGETRFYTEGNRARLAVSPRQGTALLFVHNQLHEGAPVIRGRKYVLRSDVMYRSLNCAELTTVV
jgi:hypothetical protein